MVARRYGIYLRVFTFDISLVRCAHSFDIECEHEKINSISPSVLILIVVVAFSSCLVIALQKGMKVLVSIKFQDYFTTLFVFCSR